MPSDASRFRDTFLKEVLLPLVTVNAVVICFGLLVTKVLSHTWPIAGEDGVVRALVADRTSSLNEMSAVFSGLAGTPGILVTLAFVALLMRLAYHRWRESLFLASTVCAQLAVFLLTTLAVHRDRPEVQQLDASPPTSSFPSGHTSAAIALYGGIALVLFFRVRNQAGAALIGIVLFAVPVLVAVARMYRGMHHPTDVAGSFIYGLSCLWVMKRFVLRSKAEYQASIKSA